MYVKFPANFLNPDGYIAPCELIKRTPFGAHVRLTDSSGVHSWTQWVHKTQLLTDEEVESDG